MQQTGTSRETHNVNAESPNVVNFPTGTKRTERSLRAASNLHF